MRWMRDNAAVSKGTCRGTPAGAWLFPIRFVALPPAARFLFVRQKETWKRKSAKGNLFRGGFLWNPSPTAKGETARRFPPLDPPSGERGREFSTEQRYQVASAGGSNGGQSAPLGREEGIKGGPFGRSPLARLWFLSSRKERNASPARRPARRKAVIPSGRDRARRSGILLVLSP